MDVIESRSVFIGQFKMIHRDPMASSTLRALLNHAREPTRAVEHGRQSRMRLVVGHGVPGPDERLQGGLDWSPVFQLWRLLFFHGLPGGTCSSLRGLSVGKIPTPNAQPSGVQRSPPAARPPREKKGHISTWLHTRVNHVLDVHNSHSRKVQKQLAIVLLECGQ